MTTNQQQLKELWVKLGDVPVNGDGMLDVPFLHWPRGTDRETIWHWFDEEYVHGVASLMYHKGEPVKAVEDAT